MTPFLFAGVLVVPALVAAETTSSPDVTSMLIAYGVAAPFAILCWLQLQRAQKREAHLEATIGKLQEEAVTRERELAGRVGSMLYDGALLYRQGNERLVQGMERTQSPAEREEIESLVEQMRALVQRMEQK